MPGSIPIRMGNTLFHTEGSFDAWVVGFGLSRVLIELNLMKSPWAYSVMAVTILIDVYLLYIFFSVRRPALRGSQVLAPLTPGDRGWRHDSIHSDATEFRDPFGPLNTLLGYVIAMAAIAMLVYAVFPAFHL
jgi:hypothetical protein